MKDPNEIQQVIDRAVEAYLICQKRNTARGKPIGDLSKQHPQHFKKLKNDKFRWIGNSPDDIIEEYLSQFGYPPASRVWQLLCDMVANRAEGRINRHL